MTPEEFNSIIDQIKTLSSQVQVALKEREVFEQRLISIDEHLERINGSLTGQDDRIRLNAHAIIRITEAMRWMEKISDSEKDARVDKDKQLQDQIWEFTKKNAWQLTITGSLGWLIYMVIKNFPP